MQHWKLCLQGFLEKGKRAVIFTHEDGLVKIKICVNSNGPSLSNFGKPLTARKGYSQLSLHPCFGPSERRLAVSRT